MDLLHGFGTNVQTGSLSKSSSGWVWSWGHWRWIMEKLVWQLRSEAGIDRQICTSRDSVSQALWHNCLYISVSLERGDVYGGVANTLIWHRSMYILSILWNTLCIYFILVNLYAGSQLKKKREIRVRITNLKSWSFNVMLKCYLVTNSLTALSWTLLDNIVPTFLNALVWQFYNSRITEEKTLRSISKNGHFLLSILMMIDNGDWWLVTMTIRFS